MDAHTTRGPSQREQIPLDAWLARHRRAVAAAGALLAALVLCGWVAVQAWGSLPGDSEATPWVTHERSLGEPLKLVAEVVSGLANPLAVIATVAVLAALAARSLGPRYAAVALAALGAVGVSAALKAILGPSPLTEEVKDVPLASYPSSHAAYAAAVLGFAAWLAARERRYRTAAAIVLLIAATGPARILLGAHWPSDVLAGYALGLGWLLALMAVSLRRPWLEPTPRP